MMSIQAIKLFSWVKGKAFENTSLMGFFPRNNVDLAFTFFLEENDICTYNYKVLENKS